MEEWRERLGDPRLIYDDLEQWQKEAFNQDVERFKETVGWSPIKFRSLSMQTSYLMATDEERERILFDCQYKKGAI